MNFLIANDLHLGSPHEMCNDKILELLINERPSNLILNGDIIDLYNCKKSAVGKAKELIKYLQRLYGERYILGNHELSTEGPRFLQVSNILFTHGHYFDWDISKVEEWETYKQPGDGRTIFSPIIDKIRHFRPSYLTKLDRVRAVSLARQRGCDIIVSGHYRMRNIYTHVEDGVTIVIFPRGVNTLTTETIDKGEFAKILPFKPIHLPT